jgi:YVTN family beta-propeller protein
MSPTVVENFSVDYQTGRTNKVVSTIPVGSRPFDISVDQINNRVYVVNTQSNTVSVIDGKTNKVVSTIPVQLHPIGLVVDAFDGAIYVTNEASNTTSVIDGKTNKVVSTIPVGRNPELIGLYSDNSTNMSHIFVTSLSSNTLSLFFSRIENMQLNMNISVSPLISNSLTR